LATGGYYRYTWPRRDLTLRIGDVTLAPALALGAWAGFSGDAADATMMGDLVLTSGEVKPVLAELARQQIEVTRFTTTSRGRTRRSPTFISTPTATRWKWPNGSTASSR